MKQADRVLHGACPSLTYADEVFYITRGRKPSSQCQPLALENWLECVDSEKDLVLDESYRQANINKGWDVYETWQELGRTRREGAPSDDPNGEPEWFHFSDARIDYIHDHTFRGGKQHDQYQRIRRALDDNPSLDAWRDYVGGNRWMRLQEDTDPHEPGRAVWLNKKGEVKHLFRYMPSSVWIYLDPDFNNSWTKATVARLDYCKRLATALTCELWRGRNETIAL